MARNFDDFIQRDLRASNFLRSFCIFITFGLFFRYTNKVCRNLVPVGKYGVRKINQTQFYQNFGFIGVAGVAAWWSFALYAWWKSTKFMVHKFYRHVIQQNRNWMDESIDISTYGNYQYPESILSRE